MIDQIIQAALRTWVLMIESSIIVYWFSGTTIAVALYAFKTNHLNLPRLLAYAGFFLILLIGIEGPKIHYIAVVLKRPLDTPQVWMEPVFAFTFFTCLMLGLFIGFLINVLLEFLVGDYWLSLARIAYSVGDGYAKRSPAYGSDFVTLSGLRQLGLEKRAEKQASDLKDVADRAAVELKIVATTAATDLKSLALGEEEPAPPPSNDP